MESSEDSGHHSTVIRTSHDRAGTEDIFDLLHKLAVGPLHHHYAAFSAFCVNRFKLKITFLERILLKHIRSNHSHFIASLTILRIEVINPGQDIS